MIGGNAMTFAEYLAKAKNGSKPSYDLLCNAAADDLYVIASLVLDKSDAEKAVTDAFDAAYSGISRIKDFNHLKAWLTRMLARNLIAALKEYKSKGVKPQGDGPAAASLTLPDIERIAFVLSAAGGYKPKEISLITGIPESTIPAKIAAAEKRLGKDAAESIRAYAVTCKAPSSVKIKEELPYSPDGAMSENQTLAQTVDTAEDPDVQTDMQPRLNAETFINVISKEHIKGKEFLRLLGNTRISNSAYREIEQNPDLTKARLIQLLDESPLTEADYYKLLSALKHRREIIEAKEENRTKLEKAGLMDSYRPVKNHLAPKEEKKSDLALALEREEREKAEAEAARIREEERIAKEAARREELERIEAENQRRRAEEEEEARLAELRRIEEETRRLEEETRRIEEETRRREEEARRIAEEAEARRRREEEARRLEEETRRIEEETRRREEEARRIAEEAEARRRREEEEEARIRAEEERRLDEELKAIEEARRKEEEAKKKKLAEEAKKKKLAEEAAKSEENNSLYFGGTQELYTEKTNGSDEITSVPFKPTVFDTYNIDKIDDKDEDFIPHKKESRKKPAEEKTEAKEPVRVPEPEHFGDDETEGRKSNKNKIVIGAIGAAALIAVGVGIKLAATGTIIPTGNMSAVTEANEPVEISSADDIRALISERDVRSPIFGASYIRSDGTPYKSALSAKSVITEKGMLLLDGNGLTLITTDKNSPAIKNTASGAAETDIIGFTADENNIYLLYKSAGNTAVSVEVYDSGLNLKHTYAQFGTYRGFSTRNGSFTLITNHTVSDAGDSESFIPSSTFDGVYKMLDISDIEIIGGSSYTAYSVIGCVSGDTAETKAIFGGYDCFVSFADDSCTLLTADKNKTFAHKLTGSSVTERLSFTGEAFSADCLNGDVFAGFDTVDGTIAVTKNSEQVYCGVENEIPSAVSFSGGKAYVVTKAQDGSSRLYSFDVSGEKILPDPDISATDIYTEKLAPCGGGLIGLKTQADSDGNITGIKLGLYSFTDKLNETSSVIIGVDEKTSASCLKYLSSDAESDPSLIAVNEDGTRIAVATKYFDGISAIERILLFANDSGTLTQKGELMLFDTNSAYCYTTIKDDTLFIVNEQKIITADLEECKPTGYFDAK